MDAMTVQELRDRNLLVENELYICEHVMPVMGGDNPYFMRSMVYVCEKSQDGRLGISDRSGFVFTATDSTFSKLHDDEEPVEVSPSDTPFLDAIDVGPEPNPDAEEETQGVSDGGSTSYYDFPDGFSTLADLIDYKDMSFNVGNIFKAAYRLGRKKGVDRRYDLNKIIYFAQRELNKLDQ